MAGPEGSGLDLVTGGAMRRVDWFLVAIGAAIALATVLPATGAAVPALRWITVAAIALLFFHYGLRLAPKQTLAGLKHWRLHLTILASTFLAFPLIGVATGAALPPWLAPGLTLGLIFTCLVPSTVQSSITFTSIAKGNVAGAIVSASLSNLLGVVATPLLALAFLSQNGTGAISPTSILDISAQILLPFLLGQLARPWLGDFAKSHPKLKYLDQFTIVLVVYAAFSTGVRDGIWRTVAPSDLALVTAALLTILTLMLWATKAVAAALGFNREDQIAIQFCGTKKSLATGLPMALVLFPANQIGLVMLPLMIFHLAQLIACSALATRYGRAAAAQAENPEGA